MATSADSKRWINLEKVSALGLEQSVYGQRILGQMLRGFGVRGLHGAKTIKDAKALIASDQFDIVIVDPGFDEGRGLEFVHWLRRADDNPNRFVPVVLMLGHSTVNSVNSARNSGANYIVAKPCTPKALLERILWVARDKRPYVEVGDYVGPDRRFKTEDLPDGVPGRRARDQTAAPGETAQASDSSEDEQKVA